MRRRRPGRLLLGSALLTAVLLVLALVAGLAPLDRQDGRVPLLVALPPAIVTVYPAGRRDVAERIAAGS